MDIIKGTIRRSVLAQKITVRAFAVSKKCPETELLLSYVLIITLSNRCLSAQRSVSKLVIRITH